MKNNDRIEILAQSFYGNRTVTFIDPEDFDAMLLGYLDAGLFNKMREKEKIDRTIIRVPDTENLVLVYNKWQEEDTLKRLQDYIQTVRVKKNVSIPLLLSPKWVLSFIVAVSLVEPMKTANW